MTETQQREISSQVPLTPGLSQKARERPTLSVRSRDRSGVSGPPLLTVIVPVYNEAATIDELLRRVFEVSLTPALSPPRRLSDQACDKQIIVVDDG